MPSLETIDAKVDALRESLDDVKKDVRELRADLGCQRADHSTLRDQMHAGFAAIRAEMNAGFADVRESIAELRAMMKMMIWTVGVIGTLAIVFLTAGKAFHWFETPVQVTTQTVAKAAPAQP